MKRLLSLLALTIATPAFAETVAIVNGKVAFENGKPTGVTAGEFVPRKR